MSAALWGRTMRTLFAVLLLVPATSFATDGAGCSPSSGGGASEFVDTVSSLPLATEAWIEREGEFGPGDVYAKIGGETRKLGTDAWKAWVVDGGRYVVFSGSDGAGGYENEGQSLRVYDVERGGLTNLGKPVLREYYMIDEVTSAKAKDGRTALLVAMSDGGLGAPHVAIVDPERGEVFRKQMARILEVKNGRVTIGIYTADQIGDAEGGDLSSIRPDRTEKHDLAKLLAGRVIVNEPSPR